MPPPDPDPSKHYFITPRSDKPSQDKLFLPADLHCFPRYTWRGVYFGYPFYLYKPGFLREKIRWTGRDASRAWTAAFEAGDLSLALPPGAEDKPDFDFRAEVAASLRLAFADKAVQLNEWCRRTRECYGITFDTQQEWLEGKWGRNHVIRMSWEIRKFEEALKSANLWEGNEWLAAGETRIPVATFAEVLNIRSKPFSERYLEPWYPARDTLPKQPFVPGMDVWRSEEEVPGDKPEARYLDLDGNVSRSRTPGEAERAAAWWERYGSDLRDDNFPPFDRNRLANTSRSSASTHIGN